MFLHNADPGIVWYKVYNTEEQYIWSKVMRRNASLLFVLFADVNNQGEVSIPADSPPAPHAHPSSRSHRISSPPESLHHIFISVLYVRIAV